VVSTAAVGAGLVGTGLGGDVPGVSGGLDGTTSLDDADVALAGAAVADATGRSVSPARVT
jgi:hypothetical protein